MHVIFMMISEKYGQFKVLKFFYILNLDIVSEADWFRQECL